MKDIRCNCGKLLCRVEKDSKGTVEVFCKNCKKVVVVEDGELKGEC